MKCDTDTTSRWLYIIWVDEAQTLTFTQSKSKIQKVSLGGSDTRLIGAYLMLIILLITQSSAQSRSNKVKINIWLWICIDMNNGTALVFYPVEDIDIELLTYWPSFSHCVISLSFLALVYPREIYI